MLGYVGVRALDQYERHIARLHAEFGSQCWPLLDQADTRMRNEQFVDMRRELTTEEKTITDAGGKRPLDPFDPPLLIWTKCTTRVQADFWGREFKSPAQAVILHLRSLGQVVDGGGR